MVSRSLFVFATLFAIAFARPGAPSHPSEDENTIPDYAYDTDEDAKVDSAFSGGWKSIPVSNPDKLYDEERSEDKSEEVPATYPVPAEATTAAAPKVKASEVVEVAKVAEAAGAADVAGSVGAVAAVQAVEAVKAVLDTTENPESTTAAAAVSGRSLDDDRSDDSPTADQTLYGFSKFLHDLLQVPVQVMRSVSSYLTGAFNGGRDSGSASSPEEHPSLTSAILSQSF